jgi:hypothetical protein
VRAGIPPALPQQTHRRAGRQDQHDGEEKHQPDHRGPITHGRGNFPDGRHRSPATDPRLRVMGAGQAFDRSL